MPLGIISSRTPSPNENICISLIGHTHYLEPRPHTQHTRTPRIACDYFTDTCRQYTVDGWQYFGDQHVFYLFPTSWRWSSARVCPRRAESAVSVTLQRLRAFVESWWVLRSPRSSETSITWDRCLFGETMKWWLFGDTTRDSSLPKCSPWVQ